MLKLRKTTPGDPLIVSMTGLRLGDRVLFLGAGRPKEIGLLALKPGLTGQAVAIDEDPSRTAAVAAAAQREGALLETATGSFAALPYDPAAFDVVVVGYVLGELGPARSAPALTEAFRVLRPGGRCVVIDRGKRGGLAGLFGRSGALDPADGERALQAAQFRGVRTLAERDGLVFVEGATPGA